MIPAILAGTLPPDKVTQFNDELKKNPELYKEYIQAKEMQMALFLLNEHPAIFESLIKPPDESILNYKKEKNYIRNIIIGTGLILACILGIFLFTKFQKDKTLLRDPYPIASIFITNENSPIYNIVNDYSEKRYKEALDAIESKNLKDPNWLFIKSTCYYYLNEFNLARESLTILDALDPSITSIPEKGVDFYLALINLEESKVKDFSVLSNFATDNNFPAQNLAKKVLAENE
ncbi:MAG: hypothetical protein KDC34_08290 [Saprospiraceae bacterium]|nr:hypothetical protein [Saprospiraceae bacterium]